MSHLSALKGIDSPRSKSDDFFTPADLMEAWHREFRFTVDVAGHPLAPASGIIGNAWHGPGDIDGLITPWDHQRAWNNPPYSDITPWVAKAYDSVLQSLCPLVVQLLPANKTEQPWWQQYVEPHRDKRADRGAPFLLETRFLPRRLRFATPNDPEAKRGSGTFASVLLIWRAL
jgi:hypothetical protein